MPTTARVNIAANTPITQLIDDVIVTQFGRHTTLSLPLGTDVSVPWPLTGETYVYMKMSSDFIVVVTVRAFALTAGSWGFIIAPGETKSILLPQPVADPAGDPIGLILNATRAVDPVSLMFF
jgi:hypothetical protein